ncbi:hypothetical protein [Rhizobium sullae]|nr:hypothetical protein [Rhizobium sullae]
MQRNPAPTLERDRERLVGEVFESLRDGAKYALAVGAAAATVGIIVGAIS